MLAGNAVRYCPILCKGPPSQLETILPIFRHLNCPVAVAFQSSANHTVIPCLCFTVPVVRCDTRNGFVLRSDDNRTVLIEPFRNQFPPRFIMFAEFRNDFGMFVSNIVPLPGIGLNVVKFSSIDEPPPLRHCCAVFPLNRIFDALRIGDDDPFLPRLRFVSQQWRDARTVEVRV